MNNEFAIINLKNETLIGEMTMEDFINWFEGSIQFENWAQNYNNSYAYRKMKRQLDVLSDYSKVNEVEIEWNGFKFIPI